jgi:hypothetical protein
VFEADLIADLTRRATVAAQAWRPGSSVTDVQPLTGGASSLTFVGAVEAGTGNFRRLDIGPVTRLFVF